jgi:hypothetical protein
MESPEAMQLRDFAAFFQAKEFAALTAAYDAAWKDLRTTGLTLTAAQVAILKKNLVQILLASACNGTRDVDQLKEIALRGVSGSRHALTDPGRRSSGKPVFISPLASGTEAS